VEGLLDAVGLAAELLLRRRDAAGHAPAQALEVLHEAPRLVPRQVARLEHPQRVRRELPHPETLARLLHCAPIREEAREWQRA
jgi:hypothetical protein